MGSSERLSMGPQKVQVVGTSGGHDQDLTPNTCTGFYLPVSLYLVLHSYFLGSPSTICTLVFISDTAFEGNLA